MAPFLSPETRRSKGALLRRLFMPAAKKASFARSLAPAVQTAAAGAGPRFGILHVKPVESRFASDGRWVRMVGGLLRDRLFFQPGKVQTRL